MLPSPVRPVRLALTAAAVALGVSTTAPALAFDKFSIGAGLAVTAGANFLDKPSDKTITLPNGTSGVTDTYPGFAGFSPGGGLMIDTRLLGVVGVEMDLFRSSDHGKGDITINGTQKFTIEIGQAAWHVPLLLKGVIPLALVRPMVFLGPEFVFPSTAEAVVTPTATAGTTLIGATEKSYTMFTAGLGLELKLPVPVVDVRIPFTVRGSYNPGTSDKVSERATYTLSGPAIGRIDYKTAWQYQVRATLGAAIYF